MMTHEGQITAPWVEDLSELGEPFMRLDLSMPGIEFTYKKLSHGSQVIPDPNVCLFNIVANADFTAAAEAAGAYVHSVYLIPEPPI